VATPTLTQYLLGVDSTLRSPSYAPILSAVAVSVKLAAAMISRGALIAEPSAAYRFKKEPSPVDPVERCKKEPSPVEVSRRLRRMITDALVAQTEAVEQLAAISVVGSPRIIPVSATGRYLLLFEPMHGMGNLVDNLPVGSTFSILERDSSSGPARAEEFLQAGIRQISAGIALFGPRTILVLTTGDGVDGFTLDRDVGNFVLTHPQMTIPADADAFAVNATDAPFWPAPVKRYVEECVLGSEGPRGRDFRMRWNASALVAAYRVLTSGGLFLAPDIGRSSGWLAPLLHTAAPLALLAEQAGGRATTGVQPVLDVVPQALTSAVPLFFGSTEEVDRLELYFADHERGYDQEFSHPLFHTRTLFVD
jgi:fructose-1,6-bisphosphatase